MGSPLGVAFANFYMTHLENTVFEQQPNLKPLVYCRYIDDCFLIVNSESDLAPVINSFSLNSVLNFTHEVGGSRINFLDVTIEDEGSDHYCTKIFRKSTDPGIYLHNNSECPERYKEGTIRNLIHRTRKISSTDEIFISSIKQLKQTFINNGYSNRQFDKIFIDYLEK